MRYGREITNANSPNVQDIRILKSPCEQNSVKLPNHFFLVNLVLNFADTYEGIPSD